MLGKRDSGVWSDLADPAGKLTLAHSVRTDRLLIMDMLPGLPMLLVLLPVLEPRTEVVGLWRLRI